MLGGADLSNDVGAARVVVERELAIKIPEDEVKKFYEDHPADFEEPEKVHVCHILFSTRDPITISPRLEKIAAFTRSIVGRTPLFGETSRTPPARPAITLMAMELDWAQLARR